MKKSLLLCAVLFSLSALTSPTANALRFVIGIEDQGYYVHGPGYWVGPVYYVWIPGHWAGPHHHIWVHGHYAPR